MKTATEITANAIYKVTSKLDGKQCYMVPSDSEPGTYYKTCWNEQTACWECTCKNGEVAAHRGQSSTCKHARAAQISILANKAQERKAQEPAIQYNTMHQDGREYGHFPICRENGGDWHICQENGKPVQGFFTERQAIAWIETQKQPQELDSCECCGRYIKKGMVICGPCLGY